MKPRAALVALVLPAALLSGCIPASDKPAWYGRMGRFLGLVANCGCSDVSPDRMVADYVKVLGGRYSEEEVRAMRGYVELAARERWDNRLDICAEVCSQTCMVQAVVEPLGGRDTGDAACFVSERDLHLTDGQSLGPSPGGFP